LWAGRLNLGRLNYGAVILIPQIDDTHKIKQYRPICLLDVIFNIVTIILMGRLTLMSTKLTHPTQTTFVLGIHIAKGIILKLNFKKAYDNVWWPFLEDVLRKKGFYE
jgi:hypothetical protein